ncbi:MAG: uroporphyrinogen decarboxylase [Sphingomonadales bacterium]
MKKRFIETLKKNNVDRPPFWFMRQAGRYLPEYRKVRKEAGSFLDLCYNPNLATEVTLQPIRKYQMDAAILFSDILVIPDALGQNVNFKEGIGPILDPIQTNNEIDKLTLNNLHGHLAPVYETVSKLKENLPEETALIGFAGAPWTVATYMVGGRGSKEQEAARDWSLKGDGGFQRLVNILVDATSQYLIKQIEFGAEAIQLFDTWAGSLSESGFHKFCIEPTRKIVLNIKKIYPDVPIIGFPKGAGSKYIEFVKKTGIDGVSLDTGFSLEFAAKNIQPLVAVQGNLDPRLMVVGGDKMLLEAERILSSFKNGPHIFNLGHGFTPDVPPENVALLSEFLKSWKN